MRTREALVIIAALVFGGLCAAPVLHGQRAAPAAPPLAFDVVSVKPNRSGSGATTRQILPGGRITATNITVQMLLREAYQLQDFQIVDGPSWIGRDHFNVVGKSADLGSEPRQRGQGAAMVQPLMRSLLEDRFKLKVHHETRVPPTYALVLAREDKKLGPQLRPSTADCTAPAAPADRCGTTVGPGNVSAGTVPLSQLAMILARLEQSIVIDKTGLTGLFDVSLSWRDELQNQSSAAAANASDPGVDAPGFDPHIHNGY